MVWRIIGTGDGYGTELDTTHTSPDRVGLEFLWCLAGRPSIDAVSSCSGCSSRVWYSAPLSPQAVCHSGDKLGSASTA